MSFPPNIVTVDKPILPAWFDYVLQPDMFCEHIQKLKNDKDTKPRAIDLLKTFIRPIIETKEKKTNNARCTKLRELCATILIELQPSMALVIKDIPSTELPVLWKALTDSTDPLSDLILHRWALRNTVLGKSINELGPNISSKESLKFLSQYANNQKNKMSDMLSFEVNSEIGEYYFIKQKFEDAIKHFIIAKQALGCLNEEELKKGSMDKRRLNNLLLACHSVSGKAVSVENDSMPITGSESLIYQAEQSKWKKDPNSLIELLLQDITDRFLAEKNLSISYRNSLPRYFDSPHKKYIQCCNAIFIVIHQVHEDSLRSFSECIDLKNDIQTAEFLFSTCSKLVTQAEYDENQPPKFFSRLRLWLRSLCHNCDSIKVWDLFLKHGGNFVVKPQDMDAYSAIQYVKKVEESYENMKMMMKAGNLLPLKRKWEEPNSSCSVDHTTLRTRANFYFSMNKFETAKNFFVLLGDEGYFGVVACEIKLEKLGLRSLAEQLCTIIKNKKTMPSLEFFEYFVACLLNVDDFDGLMNMCIVVDTLRCEMQQTSQDSSLISIGSLCDFSMNICDFCKLQKLSSSPEDLCKSALGALAHFWKPYITQKIQFRHGEGLLSHVRNKLLLEGLLNAISALSYVNNKQTDANFDEKVPTCFEHFPRFEEYEKGFKECWSLSDPRFSSQVSSDGLCILSQTSRAISQTLVAHEPRNTLYLLQNADLLYEEGKQREALCKYLKAGGVETSFFSDPTAKFSYSVNTMRRMINCLHSLQATSQAIVLSQMIPMGDCAAIYRLIQNRPQTLNVKYFQYLWVVPLLEFLVSVFTQRKDDEKAKRLIHLLRKPEINQNNPQHIHTSVTSKLAASFLRELLRDFLGQQSTPIIA